MIIENFLKKYWYKITSRQNYEKYKNTKSNKKDFLKKNEFKILSLSDFSFEEQVRIINSAKVIVGLHGAGFANFCFCEPNTKVVELKSNTSGKMYENLAFNNKLEYKSVISEPIGTNFNNQYGHIKVSIGNLEKQLK
tara:strand:- start:394 stop:804 length:411 start_codon:yes stop_codon:yes gene_type:complete